MGAPSLLTVLDAGGKVGYFLQVLARVAELVDALDLGSSPREWMGVRLPPLAPENAIRP